MTVVTMVAMMMMMVVMMVSAAITFVLTLCRFSLSNANKRRTCYGNCQHHEYFFHGSLLFKTPTAPAKIAEIKRAFI